MMMAIANMADRSDMPGDAIVVDEVGLRYGVVGPIRVHTLCQPIFRVDDGELTPVAVAAASAVHRNGQKLQPPQARRQLSTAMLERVAAIAAPIHVANLPNVAEERLDLHLTIETYDDEQWDFTLASILMACEETGVEPGRITVDVKLLKKDNLAALRRKTATLQEAGLRACLDMGLIPMKDAEVRFPDVVQVGGHALALLSRNEAGRRLLGLLAEATNENGGRLLVEGIDNPVMLRMALDAGAHLLRGNLLAQSIPAGAVFETASLHTGELLRRPPELVVLPGLAAAS